jgi:hypothetical protein
VGDLVTKILALNPKGKLELAELLENHYAVGSHAVRFGRDSIYPIAKVQVFNESPPVAETGADQAHIEYLTRLGTTG